jgi:ribose transport system permease protein
MKSKANVREYAILIFFVVLFVFFSVVARGFLSTTNLINVARQISLLGIVSVSMTLVILSGGIDLSVGSVLGMSATLAAFSMIKLGFGLFPSVLITLGVSALVGLVNGLLITKVNIPPLITTLATMTGVRGVCYIITKGVPIYGFNKGFSVLGQGYIGPVPIPVVLMVGFFIVGYLVLNKMAFGRHIYGIGGNEEAAVLSGINVDGKKLTVYVISGLVAGFAGIVLLSRIMTGAPTLGTGFELEVITAVVLGGVSISGGEGNLRGVIFGVLIMGALSNGLIILAVDEYYQWVIRCVVLLLAVGLDKNSK